MKFDIFKRSLFEFKSVRNLCIMALLISIMLVVRLVATIKINNFLEIRFGFLVFLISGTMFGPVFAVLFGFLADILCFFLFSTSPSFHWGFTLSSIVSALIYALFLYKYKLDVVRTVVVQIFHDIVIGFLLNTYWLAAMAFNGSFVKSFVSRFPKECITLPINCFLAAALVLLFKRVFKELKI